MAEVTFDLAAASGSSTFSNRRQAATATTDCDTVGRQLRQGQPAQWQAGAPFVQIDEPTNKVLGRGICRVRGWYAAPSRCSNPAELRIEVGGTRVFWREVPRPDVCGAYPDFTIIGFLIDFDVSFYFAAVDDAKLRMDLDLPGFQRQTVELTVAPEVISSCLMVAGGA
jgi:hypothetical protein